MSIDLLTDGERIEPGTHVLDSRPFYQRHPQWPIVGKNTWDIMRGVDFLQTLDFMDARHIGCMGLSLGGHTSVFAGAFEPRIAATISVGGVLDKCMEVATVYVDWRDAEGLPSVVEARHARRANVVSI